MDIIKKIEESYSEMTKKQKVIADFMLQNTDTDIYFLAGVEPADRSHGSYDS